MVLSSCVWRPVKISGSFLLTRSRPLSCQPIGLCSLRLLDSYSGPSPFGWTHTQQGVDAQILFLATDHVLLVMGEALWLPLIRVRCFYWNHQVELSLVNQPVQFRVSEADLRLLKRGTGRVL